MNPLDWMTDPNLCGKTFAKPSFAVARMLVAAIFGLPITEEMLPAYRAATARERATIAQVARAIILAGRGGGKTLLAAFILLYMATHRDYRPLVGPGALATCALYAPDRRQCRVAMRYLRGLIAQSPMLSRLVIGETKESITFSTNATAEIQTANHRIGGRGYDLACALIDEGCFLHTDDSSATPDVELVRAVTPGLARVQGSLLLAISSPFAQRGYMHDQWRRFYGVDDPRVLVAQLPTRAMNPTISQETVDEALADDETAARAEWLACWREDVTALLSAADLAAVTIPDRTELPPNSRFPAMAFCDPAGGTGKDSFALAVGHREQDRVIVDKVVEIRPPFDPDVATREMAKVLGAYGVNTVVGDRYAGAWPASRFAAHGIRYEESDRVRSDLYRDALVVITSKRCEFPALPRLQKQWLSLDRTISKTGRETIDAGRGRLHDDLANVTAGLLVQLEKRPSAVEVRSGGW